MVYVDIQLRILLCLTHTCYLRLQIETIIPKYLSGIKSFKLLYNFAFLTGSQHLIFIKLPYQRFVNLFTHNKKKNIIVWRKALTIIYQHYVKGLSYSISVNTDFLFKKPFWNKVKNRVAFFNPVMQVTKHLTVLKLSESKSYTRTYNLTKNKNIVERSLKLI